MPREVKPFFQCHIKMQLKSRTDQFLRSSEAQTPHLNSLTALPSHHSHSHLTGVTLFPKLSRQRHRKWRDRKWFTPPHLTTTAYYLPWYADLSQASELHSHQSCPLVYTCWLLLIFLIDYMDTSQFCEHSPVQQNFCLTAQTKPWATMVAYPKSHCGTAPGASIASTRVQSHTALPNPTWIWERLHLGWFGEQVKALG